MANPITWQNVQNNSQGAANGAVNALDFAGRSFSNAFSGLQDVLKQREATDASNVVQGRKNATQDFMNMMRQPNTVEGFQAQQAGFEQQRAALGNNINQSEATGFLDRRLTDLRTADVANATYTDAQLVREQAPEADKIRALYKQGKYAEGDDVLGKRTNWKDSAGLVQARIDSKRANEQTAYDTELRPITLANARATADNLGLTLEAAKNTANDAKEKRSLDTVLASRQASYQSEQANKGASHYDTIKQINPTLTGDKYPVSEVTRQPKFSEFSEEQLLRYNHARILRGLPTSENYASGDSLAANKFKAELSKSGQFSPRVLQANDASIMGAFDTTKLRGTAGNDDVNAAGARYDRAVASAQDTAGYADSDKHNWYAPGDADAKSNYAELYKMAPELSNGAPEDVPYIRSYLHRMSTVGVDVGGGKFLIPSKNDLMASLGSTREGWFTNNGHANSAEAYLKASLKNQNVDEMVRQGEKSKAFRLTKAVKDSMAKERAAIDAADRLNPNAPR